MTLIRTRPITATLWLLAIIFTLSPSFYALSEELSPLAPNPNAIAPTIGNSESAKQQQLQQQQWQQAIDAFAKADTDTVIAPYMEIISGLQNKSERSRCQSTALAEVEQAIALNPSSLIAHSILYTCATKADQTAKRKQYLATINGLIKLLVKGKDASSATQAIEIRELLEAPLLLQAMGYSVIDSDLVTQYGALYYRYHVMDLNTFKSTVRYFSNLQYMKQMLSNPDVSNDTASQLMTRHFERNKMPFALNRQAKRLIFAKKYQQAEEILNDVDEYSMHKKVLLAHIYLATAQTDKLNELALQLSIDAKAGYIPASIMLARIHLIRNDKQQLNQQLAKVDQFSQPGEGAFQLARSLTQFDQTNADAITYFQQAAATKHSKAILALADLYHKGLLIEKDQTKAKAMFAQAYQLGLDDAGIQLVNYYHLGTDSQDPDHQKEMTLLIELADKNLATAHYILGQRYANGIDVTQNSQTALKWFTSADELGELQAANPIGIMYEKGQLDPALADSSSEQSKGKPDFAMAEFWYLRAGEKGDPNGFINLARWHHFGVQREINLDIAGKYYAQAASAGSASAYCRLADTLLQNTDRQSKQWQATVDKAESLYQYGTKKNYSYCPRRLAFFYQTEKIDPQQALELYRISAENGDRIAQQQLERIYLDYFLAEDYDKAVQYFAHGTHLGLAKSSYYLGKMYHQGLGIQADSQKALALWQNAVKKGFKLAEKAIVMLYFQGPAEIKDQEKAIKLLDGIAERSLQDTLTVANWFYSGLGTEVNYSLAYKYYQRAADANSVVAFNHLGEMYRFGYGVKIDFEQAKHWYKQAIEQDYEVAIHNIAQMYYYGQGVTQDYAQAANWFEQSARRGVSPSQYFLGQIHQKGLGVERNASTANRWYRLAIEQRHEGAKFAFGLNMLMGIGMRKNPDLAQILITEAAEAGHQQAIEYLNQ